MPKDIANVCTQKIGPQFRSNQTFPTRIPIANTTQLTGRLAGSSHGTSSYVLLRILKRTLKCVWHNVTLSFSTNFWLTFWWACIFHVLQSGRTVLYLCRGRHYDLLVFHWWRCWRTVSDIELQSPIHSVVWESISPGFQYRSWQKLTTLQHTS